MGRRPRSQRQRATAEIERRVVLDQQCRRDDPNFVDQRVAEQATECDEIMRPALRQRLRQLAVADMDDAVAGKSSVAEDMIGMAVGGDDIAHRKSGALADGRAQLPTDAHAATAVDHRHGIAPDDESEIGDVAGIGFVHQGDPARMHENARGDLIDSQGRFVVLRLHNARQ